MASPCAVALHGETTALPETIYVGRITNDPRKNLLRYSKLTQILAQQLVPFGVRDVRMKFATDMAEMISLVQSGQVHMVLDSLYPVGTITARCDLVAIAESHDENSETSSFVLFVRDDSSIHDASQLKGRLVASEDNSSTSSYYLPKLYFESLGIETTQAYPGDGQIGFRFVGEEINISRSVVKGDVHAGALRGNEYNDGKHMPAAYRKQLRILYEGEPLPNKAIAVSRPLADIMTPGFIDRLFAQELDFVPLKEHTAAVIRRMGNSP